jgi:hypothetical protein
MLSSGERWSLPTNCWELPIGRAPFANARLALSIRHDSAVLPICQYENDYRGLTTGNPGPNGLPGIDEHSLPGTLMKMSPPTASSNSY